MPKILLVEDDPVLREMYHDKFLHEGLEVLTATDGKDGIEKMRAFHPDAVLLDLIMPKVSGYEVLKLAKNDPEVKKIPILVLTNIFVDAEDLIKNWGVSYFLLKATTVPEDVVSKVKQIIKDESSTQNTNPS